MKKNIVYRMIDAVVRCTICGAKMGGCDCWTPCPCGWSYEKGKKCRNPDCKVQLKRTIGTTPDIL